MQVNIHSAGVALSQVVVPAVAGVEWRSEATPGLSLGLLSQGDLDFRLPAARFRRFRGPLGFLLRTEEPLPVEHMVHSNGDLSCTHLHVPLDTITASLGTGKALDDFRMMLEDRARLDCRLWRATPGALALSRELQLCPYAGAVRQIYLHGKAFEFLAFALDALQEHAPARSGGLTGSDVERLHAARDILLEEFADPPTLGALATRCGMSVTRLTAGFRRLFGNSVTAFLQEHRLQIAYDGLTAGRMNVSQAAYASGYQLSSFSTIFLRRFGVRPSALRKRHL
ncbi:AraC family transcriptional regulator [Novosphingobium resinovorum]|uniref:helix-turn-helix domain-containing protein n=1 Tax=Novosphingobium resinovorum TaxID=158500 RepID=UPI002ED21980|nr:AraC family transcriptional regulator [Novosphingobium resinovorum]